MKRKIGISWRNKVNSKGSKQRNVWVYGHGPTRFFSAVTEEYFIRIVECHYNWWRMICVLRQTAAHLFRFYTDFPFSDVSLYSFYAAVHSVSCCRSHLVLTASDSDDDVKASPSQNFSFLLKIMFLLSKYSLYCMIWPVISKLLAICIFHLYYEFTCICLNICFSNGTVKLATLRKTYKRRLEEFIWALDVWLIVLQELPRIETALSVSLCVNATLRSDRLPFF